MFDISLTVSAVARQLPVGVNFEFILIFSLVITKHIWLRDNSAWFYWKLIFYKVCGILWELCSSIQWTGIIYLHNSVNISIIWPHSQKLKELFFIQHTSTLSNLYKKFIQYLIIWFNSFRRTILIFAKKITKPHHFVDMSAQ